ncbi:iron-sulfur cluster assembly scaffold protein [Desulfopila sp. IMCC35006]|uniref:iron-sulfur cluster assembly scaffold protein n=1 Tax=Desulfopila sp. IMCC35006 TaxID=2569542 RepID=UPI0010AC4D09|nr:iron-sulfur cluster assembly scaffold protein [Desulfopila sp. IMCC35006]TKB27117.1 iron-sulfur cluster assembly scaffold protein [Desulfopila sp. IMCC35006]
METTTRPSLKDHSKNFQAMVSRAERYGELEKPDGYGKRTGDCGDTIEIYLAIQAGQIRMVTFRVDGCSNTVACGNTVSFLMEGRTLSDGWRLTPENVAEYLQTLPPDHFHCAELAVGAFYKALTDYTNRQKEPWKNNYPNR